MSDKIFDCHLCGVKRTTFEVLSEEEEDRVRDINDEYTRIQFSFVHRICKCNSCNRFFYQKLQSPGEAHFRMNGYPQRAAVAGEPATPWIVAVYPYTSPILPDYIDRYIKRYYKEALDSLSVEAYDAASVMFRKCVYRICNVADIPLQERVKGKERSLSGKERIRRLGLRKEINDVLCNIDGLGGDAAHLDQEPYSPQTLRELKDVLKIVFRFLYEDEEDLRKFTQAYSKEKQGKKKEDGGNTKVLSRE